MSGGVVERKAGRQAERQTHGAINRRTEQAFEQASAGERNSALGIGSVKTINGLRLVHVSRNVRRAEVREATTGRPVMVAKIWAVAETSAAAAAQPAPAKPQPRLELAFYRKYTEAMLRRYLRVSMEAGRVPSVMGRELFRGKVSHYTMEGFDDGVIFAIDVERCLAKLRKDDQRIIQRIAIQGYTLQEAAPLLRLDFRRCHEQYGEALDQLTKLFLAGRLLEPLKRCQAPATV